MRAPRSWEQAPVVTQGPVNDATRTAEVKLLGGWATSFVVGRCLVWGPNPELDLWAAPKQSR
jgi:hypothetical protein